MAQLVIAMNELRYREVYFINFLNLNQDFDINKRIPENCSFEFGQPSMVGTTLLNAVLYEEDMEIFKILLNHGASFTDVSVDQLTVVHEAVGFQGPPLSWAGADVNSTNILGATPVERLIDCRNCTKEEIDVCLKNGFKADVFNPITKQGCLGQALTNQRNSELVYKMFVESTDLTRLDGRNCNAIHNVVSVDIPHFSDLPSDDVVDEAFTPAENYTKAIEELMKINLNIDQQDSQGKTPLHYATRMVNVTGILGLLNNGADFNIAEKFGKTVFEQHVDNCNEPEFCFERVYERIFDIFTSHAWKLVRQDLDVNAAIKKLLKEHEQCTILCSTADRCEKELLKLRDERIETEGSLTLHDFLSETSAVVNLPRLPFNEREAVEEFFTNKTEYLRKNYPEFSGILLLQHRKAVKRAKMIPFALESISALLGFEVPYVCSDKILQFLSNGNLNNLIKAAFP